METYAAVLQNYTGRDKVLRTACYASVFASGGLKPGFFSKALTTFAARISAARTVLRLFDDIPMWTVTRRLGSADIDAVSRVCSALGNIAIQLYFPFEKIAWMADQEILPFLESRGYWDAGITCWAVYLLFNIVRCLRQMVLVRFKILKLIKQRKLESPEVRGEKDAEFRSKIGQLKRDQGKEFLSLIKHLADMVMAINWLPLGGFLWSGKLSAPRNAFFGTVSSLIGLYFSVKQVQEAKKAKQA